MSYSPQYGGPARRHRSPALGCFVALLVLLVLAGVAVVGGEFVARDQLEARIGTSASGELKAPTEATLGGSALLALITQKADSVQLHSDGAQAAPGGDISPALDITAQDVQLHDSTAIVDRLSGTVTLSTEDMMAASGNSPDNSGGSVLDQFTKVESITPNPATNTLDVSIGGLATMQLQPEVQNGQLAMAPQGAQVLGIDIPDNVLGGTISMVNETVDRLPEGVTITGARVVDGGLELTIVGQNVAFTQK